VNETTFGIAPEQVAVATPCVGLCDLDAAGLCIGCGRTTAEIMAWRDLDPPARQAAMAELAARRNAG